MGLFIDHFTRIRPFVNFRSYDVRNPIQHGSHWLSAGQDWSPADRFQLRAALYENHDASQS